MRRMVSLLLLVTAAIAHTPLACVTGVHAPAAAANPAAHAHHAQPQGDELDYTAAHAHHTAVQAGAAHARAASDDRAEGPGEAVPSCGAVARCHASALPQSAAAAIGGAHRVELAWDLVRLQPVQPAPSFPTPPPRAFS